MGFFTSLKGQLGRDTGRLISNKVFGNRHATKYQRINDTKSIEKTLKIQRENNLKVLEEENLIEINTLKTKEEIQDLQNKKKFVDLNLKKIVAMKVPLKKELLIEQLFSLSVELTANSWKDNDEEINKVSNVYSDAVFKKFEQHLLVLKSKFPDSSEIPYFEKQFKNYNQTALLQKYKFVLIGVVLLIFMGIMMITEKKEEQKTPIKDFFKSLTEKSK